MFAILKCNENQMIRNKPLGIDVFLYLDLVGTSINQHNIKTPFSFTAPSRTVLMLCVLHDRYK